MIINELAEALKRVLDDKDPEIDRDNGYTVLERYNKMFSQKPNVNCVCKVCREQRGENTNGSTD